MNKGDIMDFKKIKNEEFSFIYFHSTDCTVCYSVLPKIKEIVSEYPEARLHTVDIRRLPGAIGCFSVFTVPALLIYSRDRELYRGARFFNMSDLRRQVERLHTSIFR